MHRPGTTAWQAERGRSGNHSFDPQAIKASVLSDLTRSPFDWPETQVIHDEKKKTGLHLFMAVPAFALYCVFFIYPLTKGIGMSLTNWNGYSAPEFVGLKNFVDFSTMPAPSTISRPRSSSRWAAPRC